MLRYLNQCSRGRGAWLLLALSALALELTALWFQYGLGFKPCVMCIYVRCALFGVVAAGLIGFLLPRSPLRLMAILVWIYSAWEGLRLSYEHTMILLHPNPFVTCDFAARFPTWLPLDKWLPSVFVASGDCSDRGWEFLSLSMPQWMIGVFAAYLLVGILVLIAQPLKPKRRDLFGR
ncbi:disulfide bond formation protein DsbB [Pantoea ananatis]|uniref:disulfide bond formation protein DsbB n=1 Tax=Pantoea ananas TaxID=553 RepID=UPI003C1B6ED3